MAASTVGCIGLGNIGAGIAANVVTAGFDLRVFDMRPEPVERLVSMGAHPAPSATGAAAGVDVLLVAVLDDAQVQAVLLGDDGQPGALSGMAAGGVVVVHSTVSPPTCRRLAAEARQRGLDLIDAPVSGGAAAAADGTLTLIVGGRAQSLDVCRPVLEAFSSAVFHVGDVGAGQVAKLVNNLLGIMSRVVVAEGMALARAAGLDEDAVLEVVRASTGNSWQVEHWRDMQEIAARSTTGPEGMAAMAEKDLALALALAGEFAVDLPVSRVGRHQTADLFGPFG
jgi:3-hydroxyisobutyrate dehydrogenase